MKPYPLELRERVAAAVDQKEGTWRSLAQRFQVSLSFITRLLTHRQQTGSLAPKPHGGGHPPAFDEQGQQRLRQLLRDQPDATLDELQQRSGGSCSRMAVWRTLRKLRITRKKKTLRSSQRDTPRVQAKRRGFQRKVAKLEPGCLVIVDESGATTDMTRRYGRAPRGERVHDRVPGTWQTVTVISAIRLGRVVASLVFEGSTDTAAFRTYVEQVLVPQLRPGDVVIWDNLRPHQNRQVVQLVEAADANVVPAPPWSPGLMPIEKMWSKVKECLRKLKARTKDTLYDAIATALQTVRPQDILGWFQSCGLCATQS